MSTENLFKATLPKFFSASVFYLRIVETLSYPLLSFNSYTIGIWKGYWEDYKNISQLLA